MAQVVVPYASFDEVDEAIKPLAEGGDSLYVAEYPDTEEGNAALKAVLGKCEYAEKVAKMAAMPPVDEVDTFARRVVVVAKGIVAAAAEEPAPVPMDVEACVEPAPAPAAGMAVADDDIGANFDEF